MPFARPLRHRPRLLALLVALAALLTIALTPTDAASRDAASFAGRFPVPTVERAGPDVPAPTIVPRHRWDPDGTCPPARNRRVRPARIQLHHTHRPVVHAPREVPAAMRGICTAHRQRGFSDFGYHYAVDPFGRIFQGRGPTPAELARGVRQGAHAQGFNHDSIGVVLIGDFDAAPPTARALDATEHLLAWLTAHFGMDPRGTVAAESHGGPATRFPDGARVDLPAIAGHRDTGRGTACPGRHLYALLPQLRTRVAGRLADATPAAAARRATSS